jgi:hypothetical protein
MTEPILSESHGGWLLSYRISTRGIQIGSSSSILGIERGDMTTFDHQKIQMYMYYEMSFKYEFRY